MTDTLKRRLIIAAGLAGLPLARTAFAQNFPSRPIRLFVAAAPGGGTDALARLLGPLVAAKIGQAVVIENKAGAGGRVAAAQIASSAPDGYNLLIAPSDPIVIGPHTEKVSYDPQKDFAALSLLTRFSSALVVNPGLGVKSISELIALAKKNPGKLNFSSNGLASSNHLAGELFKKLSGTDMVHIPYGGSGPSLAAALSGEVQIAFVAPQNIIPYLKSPKLTILGVGSRARSSALGDIPTIDEQLPGYLFENWLGVLAPRGTPIEITTLLSAAFADALKQVAITERLVKEGQEVVASTPQEFTQTIRSDFAKFGDILKGVDLKATR